MHGKDEWVCTIHATNKPVAFLMYARLTSSNRWRLVVHEIPYGNLSRERPVFNYSYRHGFFVLFRDSYLFRPDEIALFEKKADLYKSLNCLSKEAEE